MLGNFSYRFKVPLMLSFTIVLTGLVVSVALTWRAYGDLRDELFQNAVEVGALMSSALLSALKHDELWQAYRILVAADAAGAPNSDRFLIVLDDEYRVYVSNRPRRFPVLSTLRDHWLELTAVERSVRKERSRMTTVFEQTEDLIIKELQLPPECIVQSARTWVSGAQKWLIFAFGEHGYPLPSPHKGLAETPC